MSKAKSAAESAGQTCILVLGMHRSGTSALAGLLTKLGCAAPAHEMAASKGNVKGFFESTEIRDFNDELLASGGSSWDDFSCFPEAWLESPAAEEFLERSITLLEQEFGNSKLFVLKDPRICRLVPFWTRALEAHGAAVKPIITIRNPLEVGDSLSAKKGFAEPLSQILWLRYILDAEAASRGRHRFITSFENLLQGWETIAASSQEKLNLVWPKPIANVEIDVDKFLADDLRHHKQSRARALNSPLLPGWLRRTYEIIGGWTQAGEKPEDYPELDSIRSEFDVASAAFARVVRGERDKTAGVKQSLQQAQTESAALRAELKEQENLEKERAKLEAHIFALTTEEEQRRAELEQNFADRVAALQSERDALEQNAAKILAEAENQRTVHESALAEQKARFEAERETVLAEVRAERDTVAAEAEQQVQQVKQALQQQRRETTLLRADLEQSQRTIDSLRSQLADVQAESSASRARRKEMARVISNRETKIAALTEELQARYRELAMLEKRLLRRSPSWLMRMAFRRLKQSVLGRSRQSIASRN